MNIIYKVQKETKVILVKKENVVFLDLKVKLVHVVHKVNKDYLENKDQLVQKVSKVKKVTRVIEDYKV